ncbi:hypothetical protein DS884_17230 [Tenacibaculum sp. E3R01]|uniref:hypothetical protein n=1 Tax=Tenacibaculum sp. E3R01 TaxID=2267227 RepID=UPI000DE87377|nr:hypothetical protein [Tenacibaculum sp. E3R01]RBW54692.1 hypothetical protein DS884_17230 [Tenacibaculum sp. E3R01]
MENLIAENKNKIVETIKLLAFKEVSTLFDRLDFDNDATFLEPLLFSYFNSKKDSSFSKEVLEQILQGYFISNETIKISQNIFNKNGIAYIPEKGYFEKGRKNIDSAILKQGDFEIVKEIHPIQEKYFIEFSRGHIVNDNPKHTSVWEDHYAELFEAIEIIKEHLPEFYKELIFANKKIYLHDNPKILNFTSIETLGMLYFYVLGNKNIIYFIEELIHQGSHNYLYYIVHNRKDFFKIDVDNLVMRNFTLQNWDYRTVYGAFHGLFTVYQRVKYFDKLLMKNIFSDREKHELLGRFTDQFSRFRTGLELLNLEDIYTDKGLKFYKKLDNECATILKKYNFLQNEFNLSNREVDFRYSDFCELNSFDDFIEKEKMGLFSFN